MTVDGVSGAAHDAGRLGVEYDEQAEILEELRSEVEFAIHAALRKNSMKAHNVVSRVKARDSYLGKVARKGYKDPLKQMSDLVGARIVCLFLDDLPKIDRILREVFDVFDEDDKSAAISPELFRYQSVHYQARIRADHVGPHYDNIKQLDFEVQVRTILQDAWASVEHTLAYKGAQSIPNELKRDINALVGLFHVADKSFQHLRHEISRSEERAEQLVVEGASKNSRKANRPDRTAVSNDRSTLKAFLRQYYPARDASDAITYSELVEELAAVDIVTIDGLREILAENDQLGHDFEADFLSEVSIPLNSEGYYFTDVGFARTILNAAVPDFKISPSADDDDDDNEDNPVDY
ncbi:GTP pyrophosphokinase [Mycolicibacterium llatzerense]|uniref:RelA/SpoT domain-containing protein n=1 Tax=Mycolicibacterium llatzerense TaxID=280871 RepID=A0A0D1J584_9MYCO|nr:hypothetical protein [Mycolicibacterium llatzerense]KIU16788.1 hypothetical protein TL10_12095 [Mycolicibacterium llatzerense]MCT7369952.1 hypothetical protein [Mycolicibacterium llatzerense]